MAQHVRRRSFLGGVAGAVALAACERRRSASPGDAVLTSAAQETVPQRVLGRTGVKVSMVGLGGYHLGLAPTEAECARMIHAAVDRGVTFMDNSWDYHDGKSEEWMGSALADGHRARVFLMTKLDGRTKQAAAQQLEQSLQRLRTDVIDLVQIHEVIRDSDPARCFAEGGAIEALVEAKEAGKLRFIGFTGHKDPRIHLAMLDTADRHGFRFDAVQMPLNVLDAQFHSFEKRVLPVLTKKEIGVLGMKPLCAGKIMQTGAVSAADCLQYAMSLPTSTVITGCERMELVDQAIQAALEWKAPEPGQTAALLDRTREYARDGHLERFKTSHDHDGTYFHPEWMGT